MRAYLRSSFWHVLVATLALVLISSSAVAAHPATNPIVCLTRFPLPNPDVTEVFGLIPGADGNLWFFESIRYASEYRLARATRDGSVTEFAIAGKPIRMTAAPDGNHWLTRSTSPTLARVTPAGAVTEFALPAGTERPFGIARGPDDKLWVTEIAGNQILRVELDGSVSGQFAIPSAASNASHIVAGGDGNLWFLENGATTERKIGRITTAGVITEFPLTTTARLSDIVAGPDGNVWFTEDVMCVPYCSTSYYTQVFADGSYTRFGPTPPMRAITTGADGNLWAILQSRFAYTLARIQPDGSLTEFCPASCNLFFILGHGIAAGADGKIWLADEQTGFALAAFDPRFAGACRYNLPLVCK